MRAIKYYELHMFLYAFRSFPNYFQACSKYIRGSTQEGIFSYYSGGLILVAGELPTEAKEEPAATSKGAN